MGSSCGSLGTFIMAACLAFCVIASFTQARGEKTPLSPAGEKLLASYTEMLEGLKKEITAAAPAVDEAKKSVFVEAHGKIAKIPKAPNPNDLKMAPVTFCRGYPPYAAAQSNAIIAVEALLEEATPFLSGDEMHAKLAKCALLTHGAKQMAEFAQQGETEKGYVDLLLNDDALIVDVMELGGAYEAKYGQAIRNYKAIQKASKNAASDAQGGFFRLWALASSLEHPDGSHVPEGKTPAEAMVDFYLSYEKAYAGGELDPAFGTLTGWDCRFIFAFRPLEDAVWMRKMMRNYRPDHMRKEDYRWRYCRITKSDVPYTSNAGGARAAGREAHNLSAMQSYFLVGGICGPRAFTGRMATHAFGIPSRPAPQTGHAAMSHWTPDGWTTVFGAHWTFNRFRGQCGLDFELESRVRPITDAYRQVHRANWLGDAFGEGGVNRMSFGVGGGFWKALAFYKKLAVVEAEDLKEQAMTGAEFAESNEAAVSDKTGWAPEADAVPEAPDVPQIELTEADTTITTDANGVITVPVAACSKESSTEKIRFMKSFDDSFVQAHYSLGGIRPELLSYTLELPEAGKYAFSAQIVSVTIDRIFLMRVNRRNMYEIEIPLSMGDWVDTKPVTMDLKAGRNKLQFTCKAPNKGLTVRDFTLTPVE
ncbi:MAG: hypothetical protein HN919_21045 [Verrucomicrobia bacterium]|nr:hypothetical protein [Verrucomicrobiota bacterium]MBT7068795.1 hypothetical protein [Verrucomicrobiota bacterium]MBT7700457.1 hypothetical protein [Verrucomicrobiota bacterium]